MKKTSIFFLVISVLLIIGGVIVRNKAIEKAEAKGIELFKQELTDNGDFVETIEFSTEDTNKINLTLKNTDVNIIGNAEKSYAEVINFNALEYTTYTNNRTFNIENDFISAVIGRAEGGNIKFNGVRDYVRLDKHNTKRTVNIYLATNSAVKIFDIKINNGNVSINNPSLVCDYNIILNEGDIVCKNTPSLSLIDADIKKGNVSLLEVNAANVDIKIEKGDIDFTTPSTLVYDYNVESETGEIKYNDDVHKGKFAVENDEINGSFFAHIGMGNVTIKTTTPPTETQPENTNA